MMKTADKKMRKEGKPVPTRAETRNAILAWLDGNRLPYRLYEHERANTIDDCLKMPFIDGTVTICKNVFLCNRQQTAFYLMLLRPETPFRTAVVSKALGVSRLSFAPEEALESMLCLTAGSVSPLGLYFDRDRRVTLCCEAAVRDTPQIAFHPCDNAATVVFAQDVFWNGVLPSLGVTPVIVGTVE
jgi:Ala-tRNA(Pro) deacylase